MSLQKIKNSSFFNKYVIVGVGFAFWMLFLDGNSWLNHRKIDAEIEKLQKEQKYYQKEIAKDQKIIDNLDNDDKAEKFAREVYKMKKNDEDIYIISYDTIGYYDYFFR